jgi:hypothetical protein
MKSEAPPMVSCNVYNFSYPIHLSLAKFNGMIRFLRTLPNLLKNGGWTQAPWKKDPLTMEQRSFMETVANMEIDSDGAQDERMAVDNGDWKIVNKKGNKNSNPEVIKSTMKKVKVMLTI